MAGKRDLLVEEVDGTRGEIKDKYKQLVYFPVNYLSLVEDGLLQLTLALCRTETSAVIYARCT